MHQLTVRTSMVHVTVGSTDHCSTDVPSLVSEFLDGWNIPTFRTFGVCLFSGIEPCLLVLLVAGFSEGVCPILNLMDFPAMLMLVY